MNTLRSIVAPVDFSTESRAALQQAVRLAGLNGALLHVLHVVDGEAVGMIAGSRHITFERESEIAAKGARDALARWLAEAGAPVDCILTVTIGEPFYEIMKHAQALKPDLVVAGITGSGASASGAGSVATRLAGNAPAKVLLVRAYHPDPFHRIAACIDFSQTSRQIATQARRIAVQDGAVVDFLHVWREPLLSLPYVSALFGVSASPSPDTFSDEHLKALDTNLREFVREASLGIRSRALVMKATNHGNGILAHVRRTGVDLIVMGRNGGTNLRYLLLGSTAEQLLTTVPCALLVVNPADN